MPTFEERFRQWRQAWAKAQAKRTWSRLVARSREAMEAATAPLREFADAERQRFDAIRRRRAAESSERDPVTGESEGESPG